MFQHLHSYIRSSVIFQILLFQKVANSVGGRLYPFLAIIQNIIIPGALFAVLLWDAESGNNIGVTIVVANWCVLLAWNVRAIYKPGWLIQLISTVPGLYVRPGETALEYGKIGLMWSCASLSSIFSILF